MKKSNAITMAKEMLIKYKTIDKNREWIIEEFVKRINEISAETLFLEMENMGFRIFFEEPLGQ